MNNEEIDLVMLIISIGAFIIAICTLFEMKKERRFSYHPKIYWEKTILNLQKTNNDFLKVIWKNNPSDVYQTKAVPICNSIVLSFFNAGLGPALDVEFRWKYDKEKLLEIFSNLSIKFPHQVTFNRAENSVTCMSENTSYTFKLFQKDEHEIAKISCILPLKEVQEYLIHVSDSFSILVSLYALLELDPESFEEIKFPLPLDLEIKFEDSGGKVFKKRETFHFSFFNTTGFVSYGENERIMSPNFAACLITKESE
jgi:hypothetical protein